MEQNMKMKYSCESNYMEQNMKMKYSCESNYMEQNMKMNYSDLMYRKDAFLTLI